MDQHRLLVPTDRSEASYEAVRLAASLTRPDEVWSLQVIDRLDEVGAALHDLRVALGDHMVGGVVQAVAGPPAPTIVAFAAEHHMAGIVMPSHGRTGLARLVLGSVAEQVLRTAPCPVLMFHGTETSHRLRSARPNVLLAVDVAEGASEVVDAAADWMARLDAAVTLINVMPTMVPGDPDHAAEQLRRRSVLVELQGRLQPENRAGVSVLIGAPAEALLAAAERADLVVVGCHGRSGLERVLMGSVTEPVARRAPAVLVLPVSTGV